MLRTPLISILFIFVAGVVQATPDNFYWESDSITSNQYFTGESLLIASKGKKGKGRKHGGGPSHKKNKHYSKNHGKGHNKRYPGVEYGKHIFAKSGLPLWAHDCGLPPGLAKQNKIPPGWEKKCRSGIKYYDNKQAFRLELFDFYGISVGTNINPGSPMYRSLQSMDEADCQVTSMVSAGDVLEGAAVGAVYGGLAGAGAGAIVGAVTDNDIGDSAVYGAGAGALTGTVIGGIVASQEYESNYDNCMRNQGYYSQSPDVVREQSVAHSESEVIRESEEKKWWQFWM